MSVITSDQVAQFREQGFIVLPDAVTPEQLSALRAELAGWVEQSRAHEGAWDSLIDGRPRFDVAPGHRADHPQLRRVNAPSEVSAVYREVMQNSRMTDMVAALIGPDVAYHHCKINLKLPGANTEAAWHQDFPFTPHTNDDMVTALLFLDDVTMENGALMVLPGSHLTGLHSLYRNGRFVAKVSDDVAMAAQARAVPAIGPAGSVCLMHTAVLHGSEANGSAISRNLYISVYRAADALPLAESPVPTSLHGTIVRGTQPRHIRLMERRVELPPSGRTSSFFEIQKAS
jgi:ectoine hydroxylase-related dioxygenase (phytanoyl-CoA dioxygenase family)